MTELTRRGLVAILGSGSFVGFNEFAKDDTQLFGNSTTTDENLVDIGLSNVGLDVVEDSNSTNADVTVSGELTNYGIDDGTEKVVYRDQVELLKTEYVAVPAGGTVSVEFTRTYAEVTESDVSLESSGGGPVSFALDLPRPDIQYTHDSIKDSDGNIITEIEEGQTFYVNGTAENFGSVGGSKTYKLYGDTDEIGSQSVSLLTGETASISFSHSYSDLGLDAGESKTVDLRVNEDGIGEISIFEPVLPDGQIHYHPGDEGSGTTLADGVGSTDITLTADDWVSVSDYKGGVGYNMNGSNEATADLQQPPARTRFVRVIYNDSSSYGNERMLWAHDSQPFCYYRDDTAMWGVRDSSGSNARVAESNADVVGSTRIIVTRIDSTATSLDVYDNSGVLIGSDTVSSSANAYNGTTTYFGDFATGGRDFAGSIDINHDFYDRILTDSEVSDVIDANF